MNESMLKLKQDFIGMLEKMQEGNFSYDGYDQAQRLNVNYDEKTDRIYLELEIMGTRYEGRTERIEHIKKGDKIIVVRDKDNEYSSLNLDVFNENNESLGKISARVCEVISPLLDKNLLKIIDAKVSHVEPLSKRGPRCRKALLFVSLCLEINAGLKSIESTNENSCIVCLIGEAQTKYLAQEIKVMKCEIPLEIAKKIFELHNRYHREYTNNDFSYIDSKNIVEEVSNARKKMRAQMQDDLSYEQEISKKEFRDYIEEMIEREAERYKGVKDYISYIIKRDEEQKERTYEENEISEDYDDEMMGENYEDLINDEVEVEEYRCPIYLEEIFEEHAIKKETYYLLNQCRVSEIEWMTKLEDWAIEEEIESDDYWYSVIELYNSEESLPFDMKDNGIIRVFGLNKFEALADLSHKYKV